MYKFFLKYESELEREVFPITGQDFGLKVTADSEHEYLYTKTLEGILVFMDEDFDYIASKTDITGQFQLRIVSQGYSDVIVLFDLRKGEYDFNRKKFSLKIASTEDTFERLKKVWSTQVNLLGKVIPAGGQITANLRVSPILQIYVAGSPKITMIKDGYFWEEDVMNISVNRQILTERLHFSFVTEIITISTDNTWMTEQTSPILERVGTTIFRPISGQQRYIIELREIVYEGPGDPLIGEPEIIVFRTYYYAIIDTSTQVILYKTVEMSDAEAIAIGRSANIEFISQFDNSRVKISPIQIYKRIVLSTSVSTTYGQHRIIPIGQGTDLQDVMPPSEYRWAVTVAPQPNIITTSTLSTDSYYGNPIMNRITPFAADESINGGRLGFMPNHFFPIPVDPAMWHGGVSIWARTDIDSTVLNNPALTRNWVSPSITAWGAIEMLLAHHGLTDITFGYNRPGITGKTPFLWNRNLYRMGFITQRRVSEPAVTQNMNISLKEIFDLIINMFNGRLIIDNNEINIMPYAGVVPGGGRVLENLKVGRSRLRADSFLGIMKYDDVEFPKSKVYKWEHKVRPIFQGYPIEYDRQNNTGESVEEITISKFCPDIERAFMFPSDYRNDGFFVIAINTEPASITGWGQGEIYPWLMASGNLNFRVVNGLFSNFHLIPTYKREGHLYRNMMINQHPSTCRILKRIKEYMIDFPIPKSWLHTIEKEKFVTLMGDMELKDATINMDTYYLTGTMKAPHEPDIT